MKKILKHLGLWAVKRKPQPVANAPPIDVFPADDEQPGPSSDDYIRDPAYPTDLSRRSSTCWVVAESDLWGRSSKSEAPSLKNEDGSLLLKNS